MRASRTGSALGSLLPSRAIRRNSHAKRPGSGITSKKSKSASVYVCFLRHSKDRMMRAAAPQTGNHRVLRANLVRDAHPSRALVARGLAFQSIAAWTVSNAGVWLKVQGRSRLACTRLARALDSPELALAFTSMQSALSPALKPLSIRHPPWRRAVGNRLGGLGSRSALIVLLGLVCSRLITVLRRRASVFGAPHGSSCRGLTKSLVHFDIFEPSLVAAIASRPQWTP